LYLLEKWWKIIATLPNLSRTRVMSHVDILSPSHPPTPYICVPPHFLSQFSSFQLLSDHNAITKTLQGFQASHHFPQIILSLLSWQSTFPLLSSLPFDFALIQACLAIALHALFFLYLWLNGSALDLSTGIYNSSFVSLLVGNGFIRLTQICLFSFFLPLPNWWLGSLSN